jgi:hypothetical protein
MTLYKNTKRAHESVSLKATTTKQALASFLTFSCIFYRILNGNESVIYFIT